MNTSLRSCCREVSSQYFPPLSTLSPFNLLVVIAFITRVRVPHTGVFFIFFVWFYLEVLGASVMTPPIVLNCISGL